MSWKRLQNDPELRTRLETRAKIVAAVRAWFRERDFLEVETPTMVPAAGMEPHLSPFTTKVAAPNGRAYEAFLITSPEYAMKKLLAAGLPRIFELARCYRDREPWDGAHNPEFTMLEWYRADADYRDVMRDTEEMVASVAKAVTGGAAIEHQGRAIDLAAPWPRVTVADAMRTHAGIDLDACVDDAEAFGRAARGAGFDVAEDMSFEDAFFKVFLTSVEPKLGAEKPVILYDYPASMAALSRVKRDDPRYAERFEVYCAGIEIANAFSELNDAAEQRRRLTRERDERSAAGMTRVPIDEDLLSAVAEMPDSAGIALGVDRLVMLLTNAAAIGDVLWFPAAELFAKTRKLP